MERFRSKLNFWKKVEKKEPPPSESAKKGTPTLTPSKTQRTPQAPAQRETPAAAAVAPPPAAAAKPQPERRSEQLGQNYPAKPLPRPGGGPNPATPQYGAGVRASMPASVAAQMSSAAPVGGVRGSVPNARQMPVPPSGGVQKAPTPSTGVKKAPPSAANGPLQQRPTGALPTPGARSRASMPAAPGPVKGQQRAHGARMSMQPGSLPQGGSRGQLPQPPGGQAKIPSVRGTKPPMRAQQRQQPQQRGGARGPLPTPPPGGAAVVARGPLPPPPGAASGAPAAKVHVARAQGKAEQAAAAKKTPVNPQRQSVQVRPNAGKPRPTPQQMQRQSMPHMTKQPSTPSASSLSSSRPPNKPQPPLPTKSNSSGPPKKAQPDTPMKSKAPTSSGGAGGAGGSGVKPIVIAEVFQQSSTHTSGSRMSRRERRPEAGNEKDLLKDLNVMAKTKPSKAPPAVPTTAKQTQSPRETSAAPAQKTPTPVASSTVAPHDFFVPIAAMKEQQSKKVEEVDDRPPTPPPRSPDGDRSHRSQRTAAPKIPSREPAPGEKRQTGFMSRIKSVFGSAPVLPQEECETSSNSGAAAAAVTTGAVAGATITAAAVSRSNSKSSQTKASSATQLPPTSTQASAPESKSSAKSSAKSTKAKNKSMSQRASQASNKLSSSVQGVISPRGKSSLPAVGPSYGLTEQQQKSMKPEKQEELLRQQLGEIDDKIQANSRTKEGVQKMAELSATHDPMFDAQLMDLNTMLSQLMEARSRIAGQLEKTGAIAPRTPVLSARSSDSGRARGGGGNSSTGRKPTLTRAGSSATNLRARFYRSVGSHTAQHPLQLDTQDGDVLTMVWKAPTGWWKMALNGVEGYVPSQYCEALPDDEGEKAIAIQKARQPAQAYEAPPPAAAAAEPLPVPTPAAAPAQAVSNVAEKRKTVAPKPLAQAESTMQPAMQRRMTMPLPQLPNGGKSNSSGGGSTGNKQLASSQASRGASAAAYAVTPKAARAPVAAQPEPKPQQPSYPQAVVIFAFEKSNPTEIGIDAGLQVSVIEVAGEWSYILHEPTTNAGYIPNSYLEYC